MKVLLTGGGTGGHITPILAVAHELKRQQPTCITVYVGELGGKFSDLTRSHAAIDETHAIFAGKFRRYHAESWLRRLTDIKTIVLNARDFFYLLIGTFQAWRLLGKVKPDVIFLKGGFVGVPVGIAAHWRRIPFVTHDSDIMPGLANRLVGRWAVFQATALEAKYYPYPQARVRPVGVLVGADYQAITPELQANYKQQLGLPTDAPALLITGGSSGAQRLNEAVVKIIDDLLRQHPSLEVIHQVGKGKAEVYGTYTHPRLKVIEFLKPMHLYSGAADVIVTRAGATHMAEFGVQGKACIVVPNPELTGGHQLKNAELWVEQGAALVVPESELYDTHRGLSAAITSLLNDPAKRQQLGTILQTHTLQGAAKNLASLILEQVL